MIHKIYKKFNIAASHVLDLPYESKCNMLHGHNYSVEVNIGGILNSRGMIIDFNTLSKVVKEYDHAHLNDIFEDDSYREKKVQPTAEMLAVRICRDILDHYILNEKEKTIKGIQVRVWETETCYADFFAEEAEFHHLLRIYPVIDEELPIQEAIELENSQTDKEFKKSVKDANEELPVQAGSLAE